MKCMEYKGKQGRSGSQKLKLLYLQKLFNERTDQDHTITTKEIISYLNSVEIPADRRTIYTDIDALDEFGLEIEKVQTKGGCSYYLVDRLFNLAELKFLVDAVQSCRFLTQKKSTELINKLGNLASDYEKKQLNRHVFVHNRIKAMNESSYRNIDVLYEAINTNQQVNFQYLQWTIKKEQEPRHNGDLYKVSPWGLSWNNENYYLIAYDTNSKSIRHYRVDKMKRITLSNDAREGKELFSQMDWASYDNKRFGMYNGKEESVTFECSLRILDVIIDRFGKDIMLIPKEDNYFTVKVNVTISPQFLSWIFGLGTDIKITNPPSVIEYMKQELVKVQSLYK